MREIAHEMIEDRWRALGHDLSVWDELRSRVESGEDPKSAAESVASELGRLEADVIVREPDQADSLTLEPEDVAGELSAWLGAEKRTEGDSYMPTDDVSTPLNPGTETDMADPYSISRMQTQGAAKERALAEGFTPDGRKLRLFEIAERRAVHGETVRWEIRDLESGQLVDAGGPLFLDAPQHNDAALAEARGQAYAAIRDACEANYRDLRGSKDMDSKKKAALDGLRALCKTAAHRRLADSVEEQIEGLSEEFITSVAGIVKQPWDPGSSWEVVEADGAPKIVRRETKLDDDAPMGKHSFREGQTLRVDTGIMTEDVVVRALLGDRRYSVQSMITNAVFQVEEQDLYSTEDDDRLFEGGDFPIDAGEIAKLF